ncbi:methyltransferase type 12 [Sorangium cellulosum]|uniref:Methyltransferase type 12 n=1 Tax=Sorangium cellulosum TaxID=56 RepID=A0A4P2QB00_SORCE|nr:class I SAM-dependent methyltransferase [Sorangium cellulosum]AUX26491.1 methyltransferase type 12 [Sorangium cellulosum]
MSWRRALLIPTLIRTGLSAPRDRSTAWDRYWRGIRQTGPGGEVLWDGDSAEERAWVLGLARRTMDATLPVVDVGCGNGRYTRALSPWFPAAYGVDVSAQAVAHAERETRAEHEPLAGSTSTAPPRAAEDAAETTSARPRVSFRVLDMTETGAGERMRAEVGCANVFVRGLFHILDAAQRSRLAESCRALVGERGALLLVETDFPGSPLSYLDYLGARGSDYPTPLLRCLEAGLPKPARFGAREVTRHFPEGSWEHVESGGAELHAIAMRPGQRPRSIPAFFAVLRARPRELSR